MKKISGKLLSSNPISLSRAAKLITRFAAEDNGSSPAVSIYLQRTADAFNHLVQFHKQSKISDAVEYPDRKRVKKLQEDLSEKNPNGEEAGGSGIRGESERKGVKEDAETNPYGDDVRDLESGEKEQKKEKKKKKKKKNRESDAVDTEEKKTKKKRKAESLDS